MMIDLNTIPPQILFILNVIVIILLITATGFLFAEIYYIKKHGGECIDNPLSFAEQYALEERGIFVDCFCIPKLNLTGGLK